MRVFHIFIVNVLMMVFACFGMENPTPTSYFNLEYKPEYKNLIIRYSQLYFGIEYDFRVFYAQMIAESNQRVDAQSLVGATGLMQIMPMTFKELCLKLDLVSVYDAESNIRGGIYYDKRMYSIYSNKTPLNHLKFALASYNAGAGNIIKAQKFTSKPNIWDEVKIKLHKVTGRHSGETLTYVARIFEIWERLRAYDGLSVDEVELTKSVKI